ncbi:hypothetical protein QNI16_02935 [Cytophagaceae bacterium YF14B1]|uniref:Uncharacterized protein n=1 Tax=Xanthocytophaga flava TaxID=3048013 RepID=A0AAE3QMM0_9BACT|nr:hypothetical protein [Xanthocytophaga flavus]MDJ1479423.1 hypothetical protein [Xanthocytophaga flavus]
MERIWVVLLLVWFLYACKSKGSNNVEVKNEIVVENKNVADSVELAYMDSVEKAEAILNVGRSFKCGIDTYWTRNKLKHCVLDSLDPNLISYNAHYDSLHINGKPSVLVTDSIAKDYLFDVSQDFNLL